MKPSNRKTMLVYPRFQLTLIGFQFLVIAGIVIPVLLAIHRAFSELARLAAESGLPANHAYYRLIELTRAELFSRLALPLGIGVFASAVVTVLLSDRLAGPIVRLRRVFQEMVETGEAQPIRFRRRDFFTDLPPIINGAIEKLGDKVE